MLDNKGFDLWADGYDKTVGVSDEENTYCALLRMAIGYCFKTESRKTGKGTHCRAGMWNPESLLLMR